MNYKLKNGDKISSASIATTMVTASNVNLNNYTETGLYYFPAGRTITNIPAGVNGWLLVINSASVGAIKQIWFRHGTANTNDFETYVRTLAGSWSNWFKFNTNKNTTGSGTIDNTYVSSSENNHWERNGNTVSYTFTMTATGTWGHTTKFISNLPKPIAATRFTGIDIGQNRPFRAELKTDGSISNAYSVNPPSAGTIVEGHITYITKDN